MAEPIINRITCRAFDVTIQRYIDATSITFHMLNPKIFTPFLYYAERDEESQYRTTIRTVKHNLGYEILEPFQINIFLPCPDSMDTEVKIEEDKYYKAKVFILNSMAKKYPSLKDPRPSWM